jgi:hypothetical protein
MQRDIQPIKMDPETYYNLYHYFISQTLPTTFSTKQKKSFINFSNNFQIKNNLIYKVDKCKPNNLLRVIKKNEIDPILFMMHNDPTAGHFSTDTGQKKNDRLNF